MTTTQGRPWQAQHISHMLALALALALERICLPPLGVHGRRKPAAASLAEAGCTANEIAAVTGHETLAMVTLYTASASQERLAEAAIIRLSDQKRENGERGRK